MNQLIKNAIRTLAISMSILSLVGCGKATSTDVETSVEVDQAEEQTNKQEIPKVKLDKDNAIPIITNEDYENLIKMYNTDRAKVKEDYIGKTLKVSGELGQVEKDKVNNKIIVFMGSSTGAIQADFDFTEETEIKLDNMKKRGHAIGQEQIGSSISVYGILTEFKESNGKYKPQLINCEFAEN